MTSGSALPVQRYGRHMEEVQVGGSSHPKEPMMTEPSVLMSYVLPAAPKPSSSVTTPSALMRAGYEVRPRSVHVPAPAAHGHSPVQTRSGFAPLGHSVTPA